MHPDDHATPTPRLLSRRDRFRLVVAAAALTGDAVNSVELALDHPPAQPDPWSVVIAVLAAGNLVAKILSAGHLGPWDVVSICVSVMVIAAATARYVVQRRKRHPFHEQAKAYMRALREAMEKDEN